MAPTLALNFDGQSLNLYDVFENFWKCLSSGICLACTLDDPGLTDGRKT